MVDMRPGGADSGRCAASAKPATFALLQASTVAVSSDWFSVVRGNPPENKIIIFRPGTLRRFFARLRTASSMVRAPKSAAALPNDEPGNDRPADATVTGTSCGAAFGSTAEPLTPETAARSTSAFAVKFW